MGEDDEFVALEYIKSIGQSICPLNLYGNKEPSGENIQSMCKQGPIYIRAHSTLKAWALNEMIESDEEFETAFEDEATSSIHISSSHSQSAATKRAKQSTKLKPKKRIHWNTEKSLTSEHSSVDNDGGNKIPIVSILMAKC